MGYAILGLLLVDLAVAIYAQRRLSRLLDFVRARPDILDRIGRVSDLYFIFDMAQMRYGLVRYLYRHVQPPPELGDMFPDYAALRRVSNLAFALKLAMPVAIAAAFVLARIR